MGPLPLMFQRARAAWPHSLCQSMRIVLLRPVAPTAQLWQTKALATTSCNSIPKRNYVMQWNFNIQRQIAPNTTFMVGYVGARGIHMRFQADDVNMVYPDVDNRPSGPLYMASSEWPCPNLARRLTVRGSRCATSAAWSSLQSSLGRTQMAIWDGQYWYNGLQVQVNKAMSHSFEVGGSYTYSKNMDDGGGSVASDPVPEFNLHSALVLQSVQAWSLRSGPAPQFNRALRVGHSYARLSSELPLKAILGNWEAGGILTVASGTPFTVLVAGRSSWTGHDGPVSVSGQGQWGRLH